MKMKIRLVDHFEWTMGIYIQQAIGSCIAKSVKYPSEPLFEAEHESGKTDAQRFAEYIAVYGRKK